MFSWFVWSFEGSFLHWHQPRLRGVDSATPNIRAAHECPRDARILDSLSESELIFLDSSMVEHAAVNRGVVGSSPTRGAQPGDCPSVAREGPMVTSGAKLCATA